MSVRRTVDQRVLGEIIDRIVEVAHPQQIIMFGSAAEGRMGEHSDIDLMIVSHHDEERGQVLGDIYVALHGVGQAVDVTMVTPEEIARYRNSPGLIIRSALDSGREVYRASRPSSR